MICAGGTSVGATKRTVTELDVPVLVRTSCITSCPYQILVPPSQFLLIVGCVKRRETPQHLCCCEVFFIEQKRREENI